MAATEENKLEQLINTFGFCKLEATIKTMTFLQNVAKEAGIDDVVVLPITNLKDKTIIYPTFQKHCKFSIRSSMASRVDTTTYMMLVAFLTKLYDVPPELFQGYGTIIKTGHVTFPDTEHNASIRMWSSIQVGKKVIYEVTVSSYKDAVPQPMKD
jgi:hypothetical protein